jgi:LmbE family N-acetylglucosaminyl deacetylase
MSISKGLRAAARLVYRRLLPQGAKNSLRVWTLLDVPDAPPEAIESFDETRVLVLAPHMDDEVVGCGGTLRRHALSGARITVAFLTDGRRADPHLAGRLHGAERRAAEQALCERRRAEAAAAGRVLGYDDLVFLDRPDGELVPDAALLHAVADLIEQRRPQLVYFPCALELHPDHWQTSRLVAQLVDADLSPTLAGARCRAYEAWTPLPPNRVVDVSDVFDTKLVALRAFASQLEHVDYVRAITGLNAYRAMTRDGRGYWEAFYEGSAGEQAELVRQLGGRR